MNNSSVVVRETRREDCPLILGLFKELSEHQKRRDDVHVDVEVLERDLFDTENPNTGILIAEVDGKAVGYAHFVYTYAIGIGKNMMIRDLYVREEHRHRKVGDEIVKAVAKKAAEQNMSKIQFVLTDWNPSRRFYEAKGAIDMTKTEQYHFLVMDRGDIEKVASA